MRQIKDMTHQGIEVIDDPYCKVRKVYHKYIGHPAASPHQRNAAMMDLLDHVREIYSGGNLQVVISPSGMAKTITVDMEVGSMVIVVTVAAFHPHAFTAVLVEVTPL